MDICVIGIGYVGLVTASCLAEAGNKVICVDNDADKINRLKNGQIPIYEPGLTELVQHNEKAGRLHFTTELKTGVDNARIIYLAVGTPSAPDGSADISAILSVASAIADIMRDYKIIITKSTVPVGTHKQVTELIKSKTDVRFDYVSNPEFLKEGSAVEDFMKPDRIIIGCESPKVREIMKQVCTPFMRKGNRLIFMDTISAELSKYAANVMLATRISFMNELSGLCEKLGADIELVRHGIGSDNRIGRSFIFAGVGYGGSCFPKDIRALIHTGNENNTEMKITKAVHQVNTDQQGRFAQRIIDYFKTQLNQTTLAVWGLAFKAKTDDIRESPALYCVGQFINAGIKVQAFDPEAAAAAKQQLGDKIEIFENSYDALKNADALIILTDWQEFRNPDFDTMKSKLKKPVIFDGRNLYEPDIPAKAGFVYHSIGRKTASPGEIA
ncbi:MAG: UDP-glucose/GDP-mannose dehydrogenase family protein [Sedimentisphaerales bacterium]|nr:UDP-glucose/GDP-mannose dehydrogenase family protein [Sedimentisphaerales bacterium]